jgi:hypothetical protein
MKYDRYEDARAFGWPPAYFMSMIGHERAQGDASDEQRPRVESAPEVVQAWRYPSGIQHRGDRDGRRGTHDGGATPLRRDGDGDPPRASAVP